MDNDTQDIILAGTCFTWALLAIVVASIIGTLVYLTVYVDILNLKREAVQHSNSYIQSKVTELTDSYAQYQALETKKTLYTGQAEIVGAYTAQQKAVVQRMCNAYYLIPSDIRQEEVPYYIHIFLGDCHE